MKWIEARIKGRFYKLVPAISQEQKQQGLQNINDLPKHTGMLFVHDKAKRHSYWMLNTLIELTLIFLDPKGKVVDVIHRTDTNSMKQTRPEYPAKYVIEVRYDPELDSIKNKEIDLTLGDEINHDKDCF